MHGIYKTSRQPKQKDVVITSVGCGCECGYEVIIDHMIKFDVEQK